MIGCGNGEAVPYATTEQAEEAEDLGDTTDDGRLPSRSRSVRRQPLRVMRSRQLKFDSARWAKPKPSAANSSVVSALSCTTLATAPTKKAALAIQTDRTPSRGPRARKVIR